MREPQEDLYESAIILMDEALKKIFSEREEPLEEVLEEFKEEHADEIKKITESELDLNVIKDRLIERIRDNVIMFSDKFDNSQREILNMINKLENNILNRTGNNMDQLDVIQNLRNKHLKLQNDKENLLDRFSDNFKDHGKGQEKEKNQHKENEMEHEMA